MIIRRATSLRPGQLKHLIRVASITGRMPERDVALLWLTHTTGIRVTELALLEVADVLYPSGAIKPEVYCYWNSGRALNSIYHARPSALRERLWTNSPHEERPGAGWLWGC